MSHDSQEGKQTLWNVFLQVTALDIFIYTCLLRIRFSFCAVVLTCVKQTSTAFTLTRDYFAQETHQHTRKQTPITGMRSIELSETTPGVSNYWLWLKLSKCNSLWHCFFLCRFTFTLHHQIRVYQPKTIGESGLHFYKWCYERKQSITEIYCLFFPSDSWT